MKVLFPIGTLYPSEQGGPSNTVYWMAKALTAKGVQVVSVSTDLGLPSGYVKPDAWLHTDYGEVRYTSDFSHNLPFKLLWYSILQMREATVVHLTSLFYPPSLMLAMIARMLNKKIVWSVRGNLEPSALLISRRKKGLFLSLIRSGFFKDTVFHTTSPDETLHTQQILGKNLLTAEIPNYMELPSRYERQVLEANPYLLYIGRLHPIKALDLLIDALIHSEIFMASSFECKIVGSGTDQYLDILRRKVEAGKANHKIVFLPHTTGIEKQALYANAYFTLLPSHSENFGNVVIESMAQGTPVVASKGTPWSCLEESGAGFWVDNSREKLCGIVETIISLTAHQYTAMRQNALKLAKERFDIHTHIVSWINLYTQH